MNLIAVTNRSLCENDEDFFSRIDLLAERLRDGDSLILREKSLSLEDYLTLAKAVQKRFQNSKAALILHTYPEVSKALAVPKLHLPLPLLRQGKPDRVSCSASVHSVEEAREAERLGATFLIAGHIFQTDCKQGLDPRGLAFLKSVCESVSLPVYAIGGITPERVPLVGEAGAAGVCVMSRFMVCEDLNEEIEAFHRALRNIP